MVFGLNLTADLAGKLKSALVQFSSKLSDLLSRIEVFTCNYLGKISVPFEDRILQRF